MDVYSVGAVVVLGSGHPGQTELNEAAMLRIATGAFYWKKLRREQAVTPYFIVTDAQNAHVMKQYAVREYEIPEDIILTDPVRLLGEMPEAFDTAGNAASVARLSYMYKIESILLVTGSYHMKVAMWIFKHGYGIKRIIPKPTLTRQRASGTKSFFYNWIYFMYAVVDPKGKLWPARYIRSRRQKRHSELTQAQSLP